MENNNLTGNIPSYLGDPALTPNLDIFVASDNDLSGCYPSSLQNLCIPNATLFFLDNNPQLPDAGDVTNFCSSNVGLCGPWDCDGNFEVIDDTPIPYGLREMHDYIESGGTVQSPSMVTFKAGQY